MVLRIRLASSQPAFADDDEWAVQWARYMTLETIAPLSHNALVKLPPEAA